MKKIQRMNRFVRGLAGLVLGIAPLIGATGCSIIRPLPAIAYEQCVNRYEKDSVKIGVEPFDTLEECGKYLNFPVRQLGYLPAYLDIRNEGQKEIVFAPTESFLTDTTGNKWAYAEGKDMFVDFRKIRSATVKGDLIFAFIVSPVGAAAGVTVAEIDNKRIENSFDKKFIRNEKKIKSDEEIRGLTLLKRQGVALSYNNYCSVGGSDLHLFYYIDDERKEAVIKVSEGNFEARLKKK